MNRKTFPLYMSVASGIKFWDSMHQLFLRAPLPSHCSQYLPNTHKFMKTVLMYQDIGIVVEVPIQAKMDYDDKRSRWFSIRLQSGPKIEPPLVIDSVWDCPGIILDTIKDDDGKFILGWHCGYCLVPGNRGGSRFFKHRNASKALLHLTKGKDIVTWTGLRHIPATRRPRWLNFECDSSKMTSKKAALEKFLPNLTESRHRIALSLFQNYYYEFPYTWIFQYWFLYVVWLWVFIASSAYLLGP